MAERDKAEGSVAAPSAIRRLFDAFFTIRLLYVLAAIGLLLGAVSAYVSAQVRPSQPPVFNPAANPYPSGIYANGIVESSQAHGENIPIFAEVPGPVLHLFVAEGATVKAGSPLLAIDDSVQRETTDQQKAQLSVAMAQIANAKASLKSATDSLEKQERSFSLDPQSVSGDVLDTARNAAKVAETNLVVFEQQYVALSKASAASQALLKKYTIRAPRDGIVLSVNGGAGSYVSPQGVYDSYTQGYLPLLVMSTAQDELEVRCFVDEILIGRLPPFPKIAARMYIQGTNISIPLAFERIQPYVSPKIELSDQRLEKVDVRVLPVIFRFRKPQNINLFPGQLVDVYIGQK